jgi:hypothetical protein
LVWLGREGHRLGEEIVMMKVVVAVAVAVEEGVQGLG